MFKKIVKFVIAFWMIALTLLFIALFIASLTSCTTQIRAERLELNGQIGKPSPTRMPDTIVMPAPAENSEPASGQSVAPLQDERSDPQG